MCARFDALQETWACGLKNMPVEVLHKIAECLDLKTQVDLWMTDTYIYKAMHGRVQFVRDFGTTACSAPLDIRCKADALTLCSVELLPRLPAHVTGDVQVAYSDGGSTLETLAISRAHMDESMFRAVHAIHDASDNSYDDSHGDDSHDDDSYDDDDCYPEEYILRLSSETGSACSVATVTCMPLIQPRSCGQKQLLGPDLSLCFISPTSTETGSELRYRCPVPGCSYISGRGLWVF